ncbi:hypothetical protein [Stenotrophomonas sp.]|uniref:hypothetical protein n=1 Tax=Stenotrophomonas sp. TaxID=69392 RepID=UPI0028B134C8|nr:hypothetical protein [Stenotrophomonas sp.]
MSDQAEKKRQAAEVLKAKIPAVAYARMEIKVALVTCGEVLSDEHRRKLEKLLNDAETEIENLSGQCTILRGNASEDEALDAQQRALADLFDLAKRELEEQTRRIKSIFEQQRKDIASDGVLSADDLLALVQNKSVSERTRNKRGSKPDSADQNHLQDGSQAGAGQKQKQ